MNKRTAIRSLPTLALIALIALSIGAFHISASRLLRPFIDYGKSEILSKASTAPQIAAESISSDGLAQSPDGSLWGTIYKPGSGSHGQVFRILPSGEFQVVHQFSGSDGSHPLGRLIWSTNGYVYGVTRKGGSAGLGTVYRLSVDGRDFETVHSFTETEPGLPTGGLTMDASENLYGTASNSVAHAGAIFRFSNTNELLTVHTFKAGEGAAPAFLFSGSDGFLYGACSRGGSQGQGVLFRVLPDGSEFQVLHSFNGEDGSAPNLLIEAGSETLIGAATMGGPAGGGVLFRLYSDGSGFQILHSFTGYNPVNPTLSDGAKPLSMIRAADGYIYGVTSAGGENNDGALFRLNQETAELQVLFSFSQKWNSPELGLVQNAGGVYLPLISASSVKLQSISELAGLTKSGLAGLLTPQSTLTVTTTADSGAGSLRAQIAAASSGDTISFAPSLNGQTITLTTGEILINKNLIINGPGSANLSISGNNALRIFFMSTGTVNISGVTIANGLARGGDGGAADSGGGSGGGAAGMGGGIFCNGGSLTLSDVTFSGNNATGGNGGAINFGQLFGGGGGGGIGGPGGGAGVSTGGTGGSGGNLGGAGGAQNQPGGPGAGGGGGDGNFDSPPGGAGGFGGGGGGGGIFTGSGPAGQGGNGGFGGGGGGGGFGDGITPAGNGGSFGGNGGGGATSGGQVSNRAGGGGGGGLGGGLFVRQGSLVINSATFINNVATGGSASSFGGAVNGQGKGGGLFINSGVTGSISSITYNGNTASDALTLPADNNNIYGGFFCTATTPSISAPQSICINSSGTASGPAGEAQYQWTITGGTITAGATSQTVTFTSGSSGPVTLTLNIVDTNGCTASNMATVNLGTGVTVSPSTLSAANVGTAYTPVQFQPAGATFGLTSGTLPSGMILSTSGLLSGTPTQAGSFPITITATPSSGCPGSVSLTFVVNCGTITVSPSSLSAGTAGVAYSSTTFTQTGGVGTITFTSTGSLPSGMSFTGGVLSGTPTRTGSFPLTIKATDSNGCIGTVSVTLVINCQTITVSPGSVPGGIAGSTYTSTTFSQTGGIGSTTFSRSGTLPTGMSFSTSTHVLSGTPTKTGSFPITITATDSNGCTGSSSVTIVINCQTITVGPSSIPSGTAGTAYSTTTFTKNGAIGTTTFSKTGSLPTGMTLSTSGVLSGTPTQTGSFPITVTATDSNGCTGSNSYTLTINCPTITVGPSSVPSGAAGAVYTNTTFTATGGQGTTTFSETGALPIGLTLSSGGLLSGTPTQTGSFPITVTATDANGCTGSQSYALTVNCPTIAVGPSTIPSGTAGVAYSGATFTQTGGVGTVTFSKTGALPNGMTFSGGMLSGTPLQTGSFPITVTATDSNGCTGSAGYTLVINCPTIIVSPSGAGQNVFAGTPIVTTTFTQIGGVGTVGFGESGVLPTGVTFVGGVLSGTPLQTGSFPITVTATDSNGCTGTTSYSLTVQCGLVSVQPQSFPPATAGIPYPTTTFTQTGGVGTVTFTETGALPTGMTFVNGVLSGTPTQTGVFPITVTATDSIGCFGTSNPSVVVNCPRISISPTSLPVATTGVPIAPTAFTATGGIGTVTFTYTGTLPDGLTFVNGVLSGTPTRTGPFAIEVTATDSNGCSVFEDIGVPVGCPGVTLAATPGTVPTGTINTLYSPVTFGPDPNTFRLVPVGVLPAGMTFTNGVLSGTPTQAGIFPFSVLVEDQNGCVGETNYLLVISCADTTITIDPGSLSTGTAGAAYPNVTFSASGGTGSYSLMFAGALPAGMTYSDGVLSGTPTQSGTFEFTVAALDTSGCPGATNYSLTVACPTITVSPGSLSPGAGGVLYPSVTFTQTGGVGTVTFTESGALPTGITFSAGVLSGTPTQTGSFPITVKATDSDGCTGVANYTLGIGCSTITVSPGSVPGGTAGSAYAPVTFTQNGGVGTITFSETGTLPTGITFTGGVLSGTPTQTGSFPITITATDQNGCLGNQNVTLVIGCQAITVNPSTVPPGTAGVAYTNTAFTNGGGIGSVTFSESGTLPAGMTFSGGALSGTPTQTGSFPITVTATDQNGCTGSRAYTVVINCPMITVNPMTIPAGTGGVAYSSTTFTQTGGVGTITFSESGALPTGMTFTAGILSGIPTKSGSFPITVTATDANGCTGTRDYTLVVDCPMITVNPATISVGTAGAPYSSVAFTQSGGVGSITFSESGTLPTGLMFSSGTLSGTPIQTGSFPITVTATDKNGCTGTRNYTLEIVCPTMTINTAALSAGTAGAPYAGTQIALTGATSAVSFGINGTLPQGMAFSTTGLLSGTPLQTGSFPVTVVATQDAGRCSTNRSYTLVVNCPAITVSPDTMPLAIQFEPCAPTQFTQTGGVGSVNFSTTSVLPAGMTLSSSGMFSGTPTQAGTFPITVVATDQNGCIGSTTVNLNIRALDKCLKDNSNGNFIQFNSTTGDYIFTVCGPNGFTLIGKGAVTAANSVVNINDTESDRRLTIQYLTNALTGTATLMRITAGGTSVRYTINDTNPHSVCACGS